MINILYVNGNIMKRGGIEAFMMNYFREFNKSEIHIDFIVHGYEKGVYDDEIIAAGSKIYHVPTKSKHPIKYVKELRKIFKSKKYDIVHSHLDAMSGWVLKVAKDCGVKIRIAHSHNTDHLTTNPIKYKINEFARKHVTTYATHCFACSEEAGKWLFGNTNYLIIPNAVHVDKFKFDQGQRDKVRNRYGLKDSDILIGNVGRFDTQKNQKFLVDVFEQLCRTESRYKLIFVGAGDMQTEIEAYVNSLKLSERVIFTGSQENVNEFYNAMDLFALPSIFEGLGIVLIEAQLNGLTVIASDVVPKEVKISENIYFMNLSIDMWEDAIKKSRVNRCEENLNLEKYDICITAQKLQNLYMRLKEEVK